MHITKNIKGEFMLEFCLEYYGIYPHMLLSSSLHKLVQIADNIYYPYPLKYRLSYSQMKNLLEISSLDIDEEMLHEIFRYASLFRIIINLTISPQFIEWEFNPHYKKDLFFVKFRLDTRQYFHQSLSNY